MSLPSTLPHRWAMWVPISFLWSHMGFSPFLHLILYGFSKSISSLKLFCLQKVYLLPSFFLTPFFACSFEEQIQCCSVKVTPQERQMSWPRSTCPSNVCLRPLKCPIRFLGDSVCCQRSKTNVNRQDKKGLKFCFVVCRISRADNPCGVGVRESLHWPCVPIWDKCEQHLQSMPWVSAPPAPAPQGFPRSRHSWVLSSHCSSGVPVGLVPCKNSCFAVRLWPQFTSSRCAQPWRSTLQTMAFSVFQLSWYFRHSSHRDVRNHCPAPDTSCQVLQWLDVWRECWQSRPPGACDKRQQL